ncbi:putative permease [Sulfurospirillum barnesii SES-3]|uniref:Probable membrane transporter protein n=2 Tax=Sulfurospirillum barnesii TaxID=44674 RepID=I3Y0F0_SULBS|nr:putative permease [Sulfurospirillum barnesii SES-3]
MMEYALYFGVTLIISTLFSIGGTGSAVALIPMLNFLGVGFDIAKAVGLFANTASTIGASIMNVLRKSIDVKRTLPFVFMSVACSPLGAYVSTQIDVHYVKIGFAFFLLFSATMMLVQKKQGSVRFTSAWFMVFMGGVVGFLGGLLGIGGGAIIIPLLIYLGYDAKQTAITVSFMIPFSTLAAFLTYVYLIEIDWILLGVVALAAALGGVLGNYIMVFKLSVEHTRKFIAFSLYLIGFKMMYSLII